MPHSTLQFFFPYSSLSCTPNMFWAGGHMLWCTRIEDPCLLHCQRRQGSSMRVHQSRCPPAQNILGVHDKKIIGKKQLKSWVRQVRSLSNTCLTVTTIVVQSGASRQEHQKKERHTTKKTTNSAVNKTTISCTISSRRLFPRFKQTNL